MRGWIGNMGIVWQLRYRWRGGKRWVGGVESSERSSLCSMMKQSMYCCRAGDWKIHKNFMGHPIITSTTPKFFSLLVALCLKYYLVPVSRSFHSFLILPSFSFRKPDKYSNIFWLHSILVTFPKNRQLNLFTLMR